MFLAFADSICRTRTCACTTVDTLICVDDMLAIAFADCLYGALVDTGTTVDAFIADNISHSNTSFVGSSFHKDYSK